MQPSHLLTDMAWAEQRIGPERAKYAYAWRSFLDHGVPLAFGTDYPVESINPMRGLYSAITRMNEAGTQTFEPQEKLTLNEALYAYTQASAFAEWREKTKGQLAPGYLADLVVLDRDLTKSTPQQILHTKVLRTVVGGRSPASMHRACYTTTRLLMPSRSRHNLLAHILLIGVVLVWGCTFPLVKSALNDISPLLFNLLRMTLAALVLLALNHRTLRGLTRAELRLCVTAGLFLALGYSFQTSGLAHTTPSKSAFLTGLVVVMVPLLALIPRVAPPTSPRPNAIVFLGAILAFIGLILLTSTPGTGAAFLSGMHLGEWLTLLCAIAFAAHLLSLAHAAPQLSARRLGTLQIAFAAVFMLLALPLGGRPTFHLTPTAILALAHHRAARHRSRLHHPELGPAAPAAHPHRAHPHP